MNKCKLITSMLIMSIFLAGCGNDCDEPLRDYNGDGKLFDAGDYDTMKSLEASCEE